MRKRYGAAHWAKLIEAYRRSGLTQTAFAKQHSVSATSIQRWNQRVSSAETPRFVEAIATEQRSAIEIETRSGVVIRVGSHADARLVAEIAKRLDEMAC